MKARDLQAMWKFYLIFTILIRRQYRLPKLIKVLLKARLDC